MSGMGRRILITGGKGGVGKTTVTANLGLTLNAKGASVLLVDGDIGLNNLDVVMRAEEKILYDIGDLARGKATLSQCLVDLGDKLRLLPSMTACSAFVTTEIFREICLKSAEIFDYVLIDSPAGVEDSFLRAASGADESIIVATPHLASVRDGYKTGKILSSLGFTRQGLIINRIRGDFVMDKTMLDAKEIAGAVKLPLYGVIPEDDSVNVYGLIDVTDKKSPSAYSYGLIADYLGGGDKKLYDYLHPYKGLMGFLKRKLK